MDSSLTYNNIETELSNYFGGKNGGQLAFVHGNIVDSSSKIDQTRTECDCPTEAGTWSGRSESLPGQVLEHREIMSYNSGRVSCSQANRGRKREG